MHDRAGEQGITAVGVGVQNAKGWMGFVAGARACVFSAPFKQWKTYLL